MANFIVYVEQVEYEEYEVVVEVKVSNQSRKNGKGLVMLWMSTATTMPQNIWMMMERYLEPIDLMSVVTA